MTADRQILVYVQALPVSVPTSARKFQDLESSEFRMSHSSKAALSFAATLGFHEIVAAGFSPILREALARGATSCMTMPLCDDPLEQSSFFPKKRDGSFSHIIIGENPEWAFTGATLAGALAESRKSRIRLFQEGDKLEFDEGSITLVKDSGEGLRSIDVRRIKTSSETSVNPDGVLGNSSFSKLEPRRNESLTGNAKEISSLLSRRIMRIVRVRPL